MASALTAEAFTKFLACLDSDRERAGEKYENLRRLLIKFFEWRGAPFPEDHADETLNRVARKLAEGIEIKNVGAYCYEVARLVCLEVWKGDESKRESLEANYQEIAGENAADLTSEREILLICLEECLDQLPVESRALIIEYYKDEKRNRIEHRKALAEAMGLKREALANRAQRLRDKLERCVRRCSKKKKQRYE